jgi:uncharacterized protein YecE (DUF72 family)
VQGLSGRGDAPVVQLQMNLIGTTSWTDKTLVESGLFYPGAAKTSEARLRYYASRFPIVEVDSSYYGMPSEHNSRLWVERAPEGFVFDIKAFRLFSGHQRRVLSRHSAPKS